MTRRGRALRRWLCALAACACLGDAPAADAPSEYQIKAVFVFNFSHFVEWPPQAFASASDPFVIGIVGEDPFGSHLDEAIRGEHISSHPLIVRRYRSAGEVGDCQILFIDRSQGPHLAQILAGLDHRSTLTVSELDGAAARGVMIEFVTENNRIRLRINAESARAAGLSVSSKLLHLADIVSTTHGD
ncbi:MAG: YfiR family protein [Steroidobacteraceae bacterium]|jgi:uncharacterized protein DUF4154